MAKILLDVNNHERFVKGDMLIYDGKTFVSIRKEHVLSDIPKLQKEINDLKKQVALLKASLDYDHGVISEEEYEELCGGNK